MSNLDVSGARVMTVSSPNPGFQKDLVTPQPVPSSNGDTTAYQDSGTQRTPTPSHTDADKSVASFVMTSRECTPSPDTLILAPSTEAGADAGSGDTQQLGEAAGQRQRPAPPLLLGVTAASLGDISAQKEAGEGGCWMDSGLPARPPKISRRLREKSYLLFCVGTPKQHHSDDLAGVARPLSFKEHGGNTLPHIPEGPQCAPPQELCTTDVAPVQAKASPNGGSERPEELGLLGMMKRQRVSSDIGTDGGAQAWVQCVPDLDRAREEEEEEGRIQMLNCASDAPWVHVMRSTDVGCKRPTAQANARKAVAQPPMNGTSPWLPQGHGFCGGRGPRKSVAATAWKTTKAHPDAGLRTQLQTEGMPFGNGLFQGIRDGVEAPSSVSTRERALWRAAEERAVLEHENAVLEARVARLEASLRKSQDTIQKLEMKMLVHRGKEMYLAEKVNQLEREKYDLEHRLESTQRSGMKAE